MSSSSGVGSGGRSYSAGEVPVDVPVDVPTDLSAVDAGSETPRVSRTANDDRYTTSSPIGTQGPTETVAGAFEEEIFTNVFEQNGIPNPYGSSTWARYAELQNDPNFQAAVDAGRGFMDGTVSESEFLNAVSRLPKDGNVMETLLLVIRGSIEAANEDKKYHLKKLQGLNEISSFLGDQTRIFADASSKLQTLEKHSKKPEQKTVRLEYSVPDTSTVGTDGYAIAGSTVVKDVNRDQMGIEMKNIEAAQEEVKNNKQEVQTAFQAVDSKVNQLYQIMASVSKTMNEERGAPIKNML